MSGQNPISAKVLDPVPVAPAEICDLFPSDTKMRVVLDEKDGVKPPERLGRAGEDSEFLPFDIYLHNGGWVKIIDYRIQRDFDPKTSLLRRWVLLVISVTCGIDSYRVGKSDGEDVSAEIVQFQISSQERRAGW